MRYFYKLLLSMLLLLTASLSVVRYYFAALSLESAFQREVSGTLSEHQFAKFSIQTAILNVGEGISDAEIAQIAENAMELTGEGGLLFSLSGADRAYCANLAAVPEFAAVEDGRTSYQVLETEAGRTYIAVGSAFSQSGRDFTLITEEEVSRIFSEAEEVQKMFDKLYLTALGCSVVTAAFMAFALTRPLSKLRNVSREFAGGNYAARARIAGRDEVGELARAFNDMAEAVEGTIAEMAETVERQKQFAAGFAHELKTPMTSIIGYADMIYQKELRVDEMRRAAEYIMNEGMRLEALSFKLMDLIAFDRGSFTLEETEMSVLLRETAGSVAAAARRRGVELTCEAESGWVMLEYDLFKTLLLNLLDNALKSGGSRVLMRGCMADSNYTVQIVDNGRGIPPDDLDRITEEFYMVDKSRSRKEHGAGLGLSLCKKIAELHHAALKFRSVPNRGTSVSVTLKAVGGDDETL